MNPNSAHIRNFGIRYGSRVRYQHIYRFATEIVEIRCIQIKLWYILHITTKVVIFIWPRAARAPILVKLNPQVSSVQQQTQAKFHLDRSTFLRMAAGKQIITATGHCL